MNPILRDFINEFVKKMKLIDDILGIVVLGSVGRGDDDFFSDIDLIIYTTPEKEDFSWLKKEVRITIKSLLGEILHEMHFGSKLIFFTNKNLTKIEIEIKGIDKCKEDIIKVVQSRIKHPDDAILYDKTLQIRDHYYNNWIDLKEQMKQEFIYIVNRFVYYYDLFMLQFSRGDTYRAYMNYTIAFYKLASLVALHEGEYFNLYQPWYLTNRVKDSDILSTFRDISSTMAPLEMFYKKNKMILLFLKLIDDMSRKLELSDLVDTIKILVQRIHNKYPELYNLRDIATLPNLYLKDFKISEGKIFRSASLDRYSTDTIREFLKKKNIFLIIDLRTKTEIEINLKNKNRAYESDIKDIVINIPLNPLLSSEDFSLEIFKPCIETNLKKRDTINLGILYLFYQMLESKKKEVKKIFELIHKAVKNDKSILIHCEAGRDRTGFIIALLLDVLRVKRDIIIEDYMTSPGDTRREYLSCLFRIIDKKYGGTYAYLVNYCNISSTVIDELKTLLVKKV